MPRDRSNSPPLPLDGSAPGDVANQDPLVEAAGSPSFGHPLSRSARLAPPLPMTPKRSPSNSRRGRSSWSGSVHNRASAQRLSRARRRVLARQNGSPMMVSTNSCSRGACMCVVTRAVMTARFNDCSTLVGGDDRQLPPHVDAEFAGSRRVALGEQNVVEAFMMLAYTDNRTAWPPLDCVPITTSRSGTSAAPSGAFGVPVL